MTTLPPATALPTAAPLSPDNLATIAGHIDPASIAANLPPPNNPSVEIAHTLFGWLDTAVVAVVAVVAFLLVAKLLQAWMLHRSINKSIESQSAHAGALIEKINQPFVAAGAPEMPGDDRNGLVLIAIGLAIAGFGIIQGVENAIRITAGAALFPLLVGAALLIRRQLVKREMEREQAAERG